MIPKTKEADNMSRKTKDIGVDYKCLTYICLIQGSEEENKENGHAGIHKGY